MSKCLIIYYSYHHGNTEKIAREMVAASGAELCKADELNGRSLDSFDVLGFGSGIAYGKHYDKLFDAISGIDVSKKSIFIFSTSGTGNEKQNKDLVELMKIRGANVTGSFSCKGFDTFGPFKLIGGISKGHPNDTDIDAARRFINGIVNQQGD